MYIVRKLFQIKFVFKKKKTFSLLRKVFRERIRVTIPFENYTLKYVGEITREND